jgi:hypothetical protein
MVNHLRHMDANRDQLRQALSHLLSKGEIDGMFHRLDQILKDVKAKEKKKKKKP